MLRYERKHRPRFGGVFWPVNEGAAVVIPFQRRRRLRFPRPWRTYTLAGAVEDLERL